MAKDARQPAHASDADASGETPGGGTAKPKRRRFTTHTLRWRVRLMLAIPVIVALAALVAMRSPLVRHLVADRIQRLTGCTLEGVGPTDAFIDAGGDLTIKHFSLRLPGVPGEAGELLTADMAVIDLDWSGVLTGDIVPTTIRLHKPIFRVSQGLEDGELNIAALSTRAGGPGGMAGALPRNAPRVDIIDATIAIGEHPAATGEMKRLREIKVSGSFMPAEKARAVYVVRASEVRRPGQGGMILDGRVDLGTGETRLELVNIPLDAWKPENLPTAYRDLWRRLNVQGRISSVSLHYDKAEGTRAQMNLEKVSMNALVPAEATSAADGMHDLALKDVSGTIRLLRSGLKANLHGQVEGQDGESEVALTTIGTDINAAMSCEITARKISLTKETAVLPYMPARARQYFRLFSGPTGEVDARVVISRGEPRDGQPAPINVSGGRLTLRNGNAAFHRFPYPFEQMAGTFEFDENTVKIVKLTGRGPTGATLEATGIISPLTDEAMVDVVVHAEHVPVDHHLLDAMPKDRRRVVEGIFSRPEYNRLIADGLIVEPGGGDGTKAPAPEGRGTQTKGTAPEGRATPPREFGLAGECIIDVHVHTPEGKDAPWFTTIDVRFPSAGMVPDPFPVPIYAKDVHLHITDDDAKLVSGSFTPISGGTVGLEAAVTFVTDGVKQVRPDLRISAADVPVDAFLLHALPSDDPASSTEMTVSELMYRLNPRGEVSCQARITADLDAPQPLSNPDEGPRVAYDIGVDLSHVVCSPREPAALPAFTVEDLRGTVRITRAALRVESLEGRLCPIVDPPATSRGPSACSDLTLNLEKRLSGDLSPEQGRLDMLLTVANANLAEPLERLVGAFSPEAKETLSSLREQHHPVGRLNTTVHLKRPPGPDARSAIGVTLDHASDIEFDALGGRVGVVWPEGVIEISLPTTGPEMLRFDRVRAQLSLNGQPCGNAFVEGSVAIDTVTGLVAPPAALTAEFTGWAFESPLLPVLLTRLSGPGTTEAYRALHAVGPFDAAVRLSSDENATAAAVQAELRPKRMAFDWEGTRIDCNEVEGKVTLRTVAGGGSHPVWGQFDKLRVHTDNWDVAADGAWYAPARQDGQEAGPGVRLALGVEVEGRKMDAGLRALIPQTAVDALDALEADFRGPFALRKGEAKTTLGDAPSGSSFTGTLEYTDLAFNVGVKVDRCTGRASIRVDDPEPGTKGEHGPAFATFEVMPTAESLRLAGINATSAEATIRNGPRPGTIDIPQFNAQCYGGKVTGRAGVVLGAAIGPKGERKARYDAEIVMAGVRLAPVLVDASASGATDPGPVGPPNPDEEPDPSRGRIDARLTISGLAGDLDSRKGGGAIRVSQGDIIKMPVMLPLIQVSNFQIPRQDRLGYLQSDFTIAGDTALFERISLLSKSVAIEGEGTLKWPDLVLDLKFNSRSMSRVPILTWMYEALRNEIVSTTVRGKLSDPVVREEPFTGTRRALDRLLHPGDYARMQSLESNGPSIPAHVERRRTEAGAETGPSGP